ncbi:MAG TPA: hypothetical protein VIU37_12700 [Candidatus Limnocylindrales bacterium]
MAETTGITVHLGEETYRIVPQRLGRIERKLRVVFEAFGGGDAEAAAQMDPAVLHEALQVFIPDLMPEWKLRGLPGEGEEYVEARDHSPTVPELIEAIEAIFTVNGGDRLARFFGKFIDPKVIEATITARLAAWASEDSQNSPQPNGGSGSTTSTTRIPISPGQSEPEPAAPTPIRPAG